MTPYCGEPTPSVSISFPFTTPLPNTVPIHHTEVSCPSRCACVASRPLRATGTRYRAPRHVTLSCGDGRSPTFVPLVSMSLSQSMFGSRIDFISSPHICLRMLLSGDDVPVFDLRPSTSLSRCSFNALSMHSLLLLSRYSLLLLSQCSLLSVLSLSLSIYLSRYDTLDTNVLSRYDALST